ncbi:MAG TPA: SRPBCC domain-containing protein [Microbacteriaceae bacterium]|jgi:uncharacterized protein YndB with AHSA1/START domain|nr:SRPBCC domain-containing protein [Microbacteriaceae bacterium]
MTDDRGSTRPPAAVWSDQTGGTPGGAAQIPAEHADVRHDTFTVFVRLAAPRAAAFDAFADPVILRRWFKLPGSGARYDLDFRVDRGNTAQSIFTHPDGSTSRLEYRSRYIHIGIDDSIVYAYESRVDETLHWASLVTLQLHAHGDETELSWTEQVAFITPSGDGSDDLPHLRGGTRLRLNGLAAAIAPTGPPV